MSVPDECVQLDIFVLLQCYFRHNIYFGPLGTHHLIFFSGVGLDMYFDSIPEPEMYYS